MRHLKQIFVLSLVMFGMAFHGKSQCFNCVNDNAELTIAGSHNIGSAIANSLNGDNHTIDHVEGNFLNGFDDEMHDVVQGSMITGQLNRMETEIHNSFINGEQNMMLEEVFGSMTSGIGNVMQQDVRSSFVSGRENEVEEIHFSSVVGRENQMGGVEESFLFGSELNLSQSQTFLVGWGADRYFEVNTDEGYVMPDFGVGLPNPSHQLHVDGGARIGNTNNGQAGAIRWTGSDFEGYGNGQWNSLTAGGADNDWTHDQANNYVYNNQSGYQIGIQTPTPGFELDVNGTVHASNFTTLSDARLKEGVDAVENPIELINKLEGVTYKFKGSENLNLASDQQYGFIAQEVEEVLPNLVNEAEEGYKSLEYQQFIPILTNAVKEQQDQIEAQQQTIDNLKDRVAQLEAQVQDDRDEPETGSRDAASGARLYDNAPNPFDTETTIRYEIKEGSNARIQVYNMKGEQMNSYALEEGGEGSITISARTFKPGMYMYSLVAGGEVVDTKRMMITAGR